MKTKKSILADDFIINNDIKEFADTFPTFHYHNAYEIYILMSGERNLIINNMIYKTSGYDAAMILPGEFHRSFGETPYSGICLNFSDIYLDKYFTEITKKQILTCFFKPIIPLDNMAINEIQGLQLKIESNPSRKYIYLSLILDILYEYARKADEKYRLISGSQLSPIMIYISEHFMEISNLEDIAKVFFMSKNYLCSLFKKQTGMTIVYYINSLRIQYACARLSDTSYSINEISLQCGFESTAYFGRVFKKFLGCTPSEFRSKNTKTYKSKLYS